MELLRAKAGHVASFNALGSDVTDNVFDVYNRRQCTFSLGDREVSISARKPPVVRNGDDVVVVGERDRTGVLRAFAYVNVTRGVGDVMRPSSPWKTYGVLLVLMGIMGLVSLALTMLANIGESENLVGRPLWVAMAGVMLVIIAFGVLLFRRGNRYALAIRMVREASEKAASGAR